MNSNPKDPLIELNAITILVLDDEPLIRLMVCSKLEQAGARVSEARDCAEALELVRNTDFDAAIFDYRLPDGAHIRTCHLFFDGLPTDLSIP